MSDDTLESLDDVLRAIGREDATVTAPARLEAAVMRAWDAEPAGRRERQSRSRWATAAWIGFSGASAAALVFVAISRPPSSDSASRVEPAVPEAPRVIRTMPPEPPEAARMASIRPAPAPARNQRRISSSVGDYVLVPEPFADPGTLQVVRVRMSRVAFASLGVPIGNPDADGMVEVEMVVGDDGVARSIRRAAFVNDIDEGRER